MVLKQTIPLQLEEGLRLLLNTTNYNNLRKFNAEQTLNRKKSHTKTDKID